MWNKFFRTGKSDGNNLREINKFTNVSCWNKITQRLRQRTSNKILKDPDSQLRNQIYWKMKMVTMNTNLIHNSTVFLPLFLVIFLTIVKSSPVSDTGKIYE